MELFAFIEGNSGDMGLLRHSETPSRTAELANPFDVTGDAPRPAPGKSYEKILLQVHGECDHCKCFDTVCAVCACDVQVC